MTDLVKMLTKAAAAAIANERPSLEHPAGKIRGVTVELTLGADGQLGPVTVYVERRTTGPALLNRKVNGSQM